MSIVLPGSSKRAFLRLFGRKPEADRPVTSQKPLAPHEIARLFNKKQAQIDLSAEPAAKLNDKEKSEAERLSAMRRALYSKD